jgi:hypothetical protein
MRKTIDILYECCMMDVIPPVSVIHDYFNINNNNNDDNLSMILGLYQGMFKCRNMKKSIVEKAYKNNQLDKLIHDSYKSYGGIAKSGYYRKFCEDNIVIGETYYDLRETPKIKIKTK